VLKSIREAYRAFEALDEGQKAVFFSLIRDGIPADAPHAIAFRKPKDERPSHAHVLYRIESILMLEGDIRIAARKVLEAVREGLGYDHLSLGLLEEGKVVRFLAHVGYEEGKAPETLSDQEGIIGLAVFKMDMVNVGDVSKVPQYIKALKGIQSEIAVPICGIGGKVMGVLNAESFNGCSKF